MNRPNDVLASRVAELLGFQAVTWEPVYRGYTPTHRFVVQGEGGSAFVKIGATPLTARLVNREIDAYRSLSGPFMPRLLAWRHDQVNPILITEDLSSSGHRHGQRKWFR